MAVSRIQQIEDHATSWMSDFMAPDLGIAHGYPHVDRVRCWALQIAAHEGFEGSEIVEAAALLHDIGLTRVESEQRGQHGRVGAGIAAQFLRDRQLFADQEIEVVSAAIRCHNSSGGGGLLGDILRDADRLDALGAVGIMRAFASRHASPAYDPLDVKGDTWDMAMRGFEQRFAERRGIGAHAIDQVNFQISLYGELHTETAQRMAQPMFAFMKAFVIQLESEVHAAQQRR